MCSSEMLQSYFSLCLSKVFCSLKCSLSVYSAHLLHVVCVRMKGTSAMLLNFARAAQML